MSGGTEAPKLRLSRLSDARRVEYGPLAHYFPLVADGETPVRTGIQVGEPGYIAPLHWHPYVELLFVVEGEAEVWLQGGESEALRMTAGDCVVLPANVPHSFRTVGEHRMRLLGIHASASRVVNYLDRQTDANGYPILDAALNPVSQVAD
jgi:mannose-6-phosphate isomerase-like protein (cupin superfamily)